MPGLVVPLVKSMRTTLLTGIVMMMLLATAPAVSAADDETLPPLLDEDFVWCVAESGGTGFVCIANGEGNCRYTFYPWYPGPDFGVLCNPEPPL